MDIRTIKDEGQYQLLVSRKVIANIDISMTSTTKSAVPETLMLFVHDDIRVFEVYGATSCSFEVFFIGGKSISYGYQHVEPQGYDDGLSQAYEVLFDETLKRLESKGVHLSL